MANANTAPLFLLVQAVLDLVVDTGPDGAATADVRVPAPDTLPPAVGPVAAALAEHGPESAAAVWRELGQAEPAEFDLDDDAFEDAVWGAIELHRSELVWPLLRLWADLRPHSSRAWTMIGWAHQVDGELDAGTTALRRALELDPDNDDAAQLLRSPPPA